LIDPVEDREDRRGDAASDLHWKSDHPVARRFRFRMLLASSPVAGGFILIMR
jgi:hypothetical protein